MAPLTYLRRVQQVLSDVAKDHKDSIGYEKLVAKVFVSTGEQSDRVGRRRRAFVDRALRRESRAKRITLLTSAAHPYIRLTKSGNDFYANWGFHSLLPDRRLQRLTIDQIKAETKVLFNVLSDIQAAFVEIQPDVVAHQDLANMPAAIESLFVSIDDLEHANSQLQLDLSFEETRRRSLRGIAMRGLGFC